MVKNTPHGIRKCGSFTMYVITFCMLLLECPLTFEVAKQSYLHLNVCAANGVNVQLKNNQKSNIVQLTILKPNNAHAM